MGSALHRLSQRRRALSVIDDVFRQPRNVQIIHYSCESFYDRNGWISPRITSIATMNVFTKAATSFSVHLIAEEFQLAGAAIQDNFDLIECQMLEKFYAYVAVHIDSQWLHWNMRDVNYGFQAIAHRFAVLGGQPVHIHDSLLVNVADLLPDIYGRDYIPHKRFENIMRKNEISDLDFLTGADEATAFNNGEYVRLHRSTLRKVQVLFQITERTWLKSLKTNAKPREIYGNVVIGSIESVLETTAGRVLYFVLATIGMIASVLQIMQLF